jgi:hypothetical protein
VAGVGWIAKDHFDCEPRKSDEVVLDSMEESRERGTAKGLVGKLDHSGISGKMKTLLICQRKEQPKSGGSHDAVRESRFWWRWCSIGRWWDSP